MTVTMTVTVKPESEKSHFLLLLPIGSTLSGIPSSSSCAEAPARAAPVPTACRRDRNQGSVNDAFADFLGQPDCPFVARQSFVLCPLLCQALLQLGGPVGQSYLGQSLLALGVVRYAGKSIRRGGADRTGGVVSVEEGGCGAAGAGVMG